MGFSLHTRLGSHACSAEMGGSWKGEKNEGIKDLQREEVKKTLRDKTILSSWWILPYHHDIHIGIKEYPLRVSALVPSPLLFANVRGFVVVFVYLFCLETGFHSLVLAEVEFVI